MPRIIRNALYLKLKELPELRGFQRDFERLTGFRLRFVDELGLGDREAGASAPLCDALRESAPGRAMCSRMRHGLLARAAEKPACELCDAGLQEAAVPLRVGGIPAGFFLFGGTPPSKPKPPTVHRAHHLLRHHGVDFGEDRLESLLEGSKITPSETMQACVRIVQLAARQIALKLTDRLADPRATLPPTVRKACAHIQAHARSEDLRLEDVATHCGVSAGHLSRTFHHATGLTFREYLTRVRVEHAAGLVLRSQRRITDIAYESGFQSLSQFHRAFRKAHGVPPRKLRAGRKA